MLKNKWIQYVLIGVGLYLVYRWYMKRNGGTVSVPAKDVSATTLEPGSDSQNSNTDPQITSEVTRIYAPDNY